MRRLIIEDMQGMSKFNQDPWFAFKHISLIYKVAEQGARKLSYVEQQHFELIHPVNSFKRKLNTETISQVTVLFLGLLDKQTVNYR